MIDTISEDQPLTKTSSNDHENPVVTVTGLTKLYHIVVKNKNSTVIINTTCWIMLNPGWIMLNIRSHLLSMPLKPLRVVPLNHQISTKCPAISSSSSKLLASGGASAIRRSAVFKSFSGASEPPKQLLCWLKPGWLYKEQQRPNFIQ